MGGSYSGYGNSRNNGQNKCGGTYEFKVIPSKDIEDIFSEILVGDLVMLSVFKDGSLPTFAVVQMKNSNIIGLVPSRYNFLIQCIDNGWGYEGEVIDVDNSDVQSVKVRVTGNLI